MGEEDMLSKCQDNYIKIILVVLIQSCKYMRFLNWKEPKNVHDLSFKDLTNELFGLLNIVMASCSTPEGEMYCLLLQKRPNKHPNSVHITFEFHRNVKKPPWGFTFHRNYNFHPEKCQLLQRIMV
jgi:hypothetical protein